MKQYCWDGGKGAIPVTAMDTNHIINVIPVVQKRIKTIEEVCTESIGVKVLLEEKELLLAMQAELRKRLFKKESEL